MSKILVTGATGLIGRYAVNELESKGHEVLAVSRSGKIPLNLHDANAVKNFMSAYKPEYLLHLAWDVVPGFMTRPNNLDWVAASLNLLKIFAESGGSRAVFAGTCFEYDLNYGFLQEDFTPLKPDSLYGTAKLAMHNLACEWAKKVGLNFAWGHVFFLYGKNERAERIVPYIIDSFLKGEKPILKFPYILRDYLYAADMAGGLIALMMSDFNGAVNICSGEATPLRAIVEKAAHIIGCPAPEYEEVFDEKMPPFVAGDCRRLNHIIGFRPRYSWETGLAEVIEERKALLK